MKKDYLNQFLDKFETNPCVVSQAPGRLEILGNHTDYNQGSVMSMAVNKYTKIYFSHASGTKCRVYSPQLDDNVREFNTDELNEPLAGKDWLNYIRGCVYALQVHGYQVGAFDALISSDIPLSAGVSSSAALEMALISGLEMLFELSIPMKEKAKLGQYCENNYIMANTGLMDQLSSLSGKQNQIIISEYKNLEIKYATFPEELSIVVINSHIEHDLSQEYNERRRQCTEVLDILRQFYPNIEALCESTVENLTEHQDEIPRLAYLRALHVLGENERVSKASDYLSSGDYVKFGELLFESHESSRVNFENSCDELDVLVQYAKQSGICLGARLSGGGFGGISIHLVNCVDAEKYMNLAVAAFQEMKGIVPQAFICNSSDGATAKYL